MIRVDCLGLASKNFKIKVITEVVPKDFAIGTLDDSFGDALPKIERLSKQGYTKFFVHCNWTAVTHKIIALKKLKEKCDKWQDFAKSSGSLLWLSHSLEYDEPNENKVKKRIDMIKKLAPSSVPVNSWYKGATVAGVLTERHGDITVKPGEIVSTDGVDWREINLKNYIARNKHAYMTALWRHEFNLRKTNEDSTPIQDRKVIPTVGMMRDLLTTAGVI